MDNISRDVYETLIANAKTLEKDPHGLKVLETADGKIIKIFRRKHLFSSAALRPYAARFVNNANKLHELEIPTVQIENLFNCSDIKRHIVIYKKLSGELLRNAFKSHAAPEALFATFGKFVAELHHKGVYFRSMHFNSFLFFRRLSRS
jgi:tRNA A-37 threonylcarbamoyl transferase component Bud32